MELYKTVILHTDDPADVKAIFDSMVRDQPFALLVAMGADDETKNLVQLADRMAGGGSVNTWRRVVWVRDPGQVPALIEGLGSRPGVPSPAGGDALGFFVGLEDAISEVLQRGEAITKGRIVRGFILAEGGGA